MTTKKKVKKLPKPGTWKAIEHELESQGAIGNPKVEDGDSFLVYGKFSQKAIDAFTDRWRFSVQPVSALLVFLNNRRIKERMRFGGNDEALHEYTLWKKRRVWPERGGMFLEDSPLNWDDRFRFYESNDRHICRCSMGLAEYFYMDRVI